MAEEPTKKTPTATLGAAHDRTLGGAIGYLIATAAIHLTGVSPPPEAAGVIYTGAGGIGVELGRAVPARYRRALQYTLVLLGGLVMAGLSGCAILHTGPDQWQIHPVSKAGEEVQTLSWEDTGIRIVISDTTAGGMPSIRVGRQKAQLTRVPAFSKGTTVPSVAANSSIDAETGVRTGDSLEVGTYADEPETD